MKRNISVLIIFVMLFSILSTPLNAKAAVNSKKPSTPVLAQDIKTKTDKSVKVTITNWGNAVKKEYKINNGSWQKYTSPIVITVNSKIYGRGTNASGIVSDVSMLYISNIRPLLSKIDVSKQSVSSVKVVYYDINGNEIGNGSGFITSSDGQVVTNYHVIDMVAAVKVITSDDKIYNVLGVTAYDPKRDLAVLKLEGAKNLPSVNLGNSDELKLGEEVVSIGYPLGLKVTVSFGNVSSLNTPGALTRSNYKDIQITTPISNGSSGGPLINMYGEVVGINYSIIKNAQNINYSIPVNELKPMLSSKAIKQFSEVIKEAYPSMNYSQYEDYIYFNYLDYKSADYTFSFSAVTIDEPADCPNEVDVYLDLNPKKYSEILLAELEGNKQLVEKWVNEIFKNVKAINPNKDVYVIISLNGTFNQRPEGYDDDDVYFNSLLNKWTVYKIKLVYTYKNDIPTPRWY